MFAQARKKSYHVYLSQRSRESLRTLVRQAKEKW